MKSFKELLEGNLEFILLTKNKVIKSEIRKNSKKNRDASMKEIDDWEAKSEDNEGKLIVTTKSSDFNKK